jgi:hypothetical protein
MPDVTLRQFSLSERADGYWRTVSGIPPVNLMNTQTASELQLHRGRPRFIRVLVFSSVNSGFSFARYDVGDAAGRTRPARQGCHRSLDMTVRLSRPQPSASRASAEPLRRMASLVQVAGHHADPAA